MAGPDTDEEDKTEEPSARKLEKAFEKADVPKSMEIYTLFILAISTLIMVFAGSWLSGLLAHFSLPFVERPHELPVDGDGATRILWHVALSILLVCALPFAGLMCAAIIGSMVQHRFVFSTEQLTPKLNRLSPMAGFKRIYGKEALVQFVKGVIKLAIVGAIVSVVLWNERATLGAYAAADVTVLLPDMLRIIIKVLSAVLVAHAFLALADYGYQRWTWYKRQRMTREELKQEFKETEGSPEVKQRLRRLRMEAAKRRMMAAVPKASVIITNPTHYSVALQYEPGMNAPILLAKGVDALALRIREIANENDIPIVENPPLARAIHATVDIDEEIKSDQYKAVAEVIGYVLRLKRRRA
jgi:flagellar biosynthesis protein FlhB